eukprot:15479546-Alexandrium_andersonii.AAC.1
MARTPRTVYTELCCHPRVHMRDQWRGALLQCPLRRPSKQQATRRINNAMATLLQIEPVFAQHAQPQLQPARFTKYLATLQRDVSLLQLLTSSFEI